MGNQQVLSSPFSNSKFNKIQSCNNHMIIHIDFDSQANQLTPWLALNSHRSQTYLHPLSLNGKLQKIIKNGLCTDSCTALFKADKYTVNLHDQIIQRQKIGRYFTHEQIWYMLHAIVKLAIFVHQKGMKCIIGNVHPKNILINQDGNIKIINLNSFPFQMDHYQTYKKLGIDQAYISPQLLGFALNKKEYDVFPQCVNKQISETFTIGITVLSTCTLQPKIDTIYDKSYYIDQYQKSKNTNKIQLRKRSIHYVHSFDQLINQQLMKEYLDFVKHKYCELLATILGALLNPNPKSRYSLNLLYYQILQPNQQSILNMNLNWLGLQSNQK